MRNRHLALLLALAALTAVCSPARAQSSRVNHSSSLLPDGNILVVGGRNAAGTVLATAEIFPSAQDGPAVAVAASMTNSRSSHTATVLPDGRVLVVGGIDNVGTYLANAEVYNPVTQTWGAPVPFAGGMLARHSHTATLLPNGRVLIAGGQDTAGHVTETCGVFDPSANGGLGSFTRVADLLQPRAGHTATLLYNGKVFVAGGFLFPIDYSVSTELYDYVNNIWTPGPSLIQKRAFHAATGLGNRNVAITGGYNGRNVKETHGILDTVEIYNPLSDSISPGAPMGLRKMLHTSTLDPSGMLRHYGGLGNFTTSYFKADLKFQDPSFMAVASVRLSTGAISSTSTLNLNFNPSLSLPNVMGPVVDGDVLFSSPTLTLEDGKVYFSGARASINGQNINSGVLNPYKDNIAMTNPAGTVLFYPRSTSSRDTLAAAGSSLAHNGGGGNCPGNTECNIISGTLNLTSLDVDFPIADVGGQVMLGEARIVDGYITRYTDPTEGGYTITLTSGTTTITGGIIVPSVDESKGRLLMLNRSFTGVEGTIRITTTTARASPVNVTGLDVTGITMRLQYIVSPVNLAGLTFEYDIATVTVRRMVFGNAETYNPSKNEWDFGAIGPPVYNHTSLLSPNGDEAFFGGETCAAASPTCATRDVRRTDLPAAMIPVPIDLTKAWTSPNTKLLTARSHHTTTLLPSGHILTAGGTNGSAVLNSSELYDPAIPGWTTVGSMRYSRNLHTATLLPNGRVLAAGGFVSVGSTGATRSAELYFPESRVWIPTGQMVSSRSYHTSILLPDGNVLIAGGYDAGGNFLNSAEIYITTAHVWRQIPSMTTRRAQHTMTLEQNGKVLVIGGVNTGIVGTVEEYNPVTGLWNEAPARTSLQTARYGHSATLLRDGRILVAGGDDGFGEIGMAEIYNPVTNSWAYTTSFGGASGNDMNVPRLRHNATLLPDGKVLITGGVNALGEPLKDSEGFDVDHSTWQVQGDLIEPRAYHTAVLTAEGNVVLVGGFNGTSRLQTMEYRYHAPGTIDSASPPPSMRLPEIVSIDTMTVVRGTSVTLRGTHFQGGTEASGGRGSAQSSHHLPRVYLQRLDGSGNNTQSHSGFLVDLTTRVYEPAYNSWSLMDSSITVQIPTSVGLAPIGWYQARVAANAQFSVAKSLQIGPTRPSNAPGIPLGVVLGVSSVSWTWTAAGGSFDGYNIYSTTNGVFLATSATNAYIQRDLGPDTVASIMVAPYNISGDGPLVRSTISYTTPSGAVNGLAGAAQDARSILWSWSANTSASSYKVYSTSATAPIAVAPSNSYLMIGLSTNSAYGVQVQAVTETGNGSLSPTATVYTLAAEPLVGVPALTYVSTGGFLATWMENQNPSSTKYALKLLVHGEPAASAILLDEIPGDVTQTGVSAETTVEKPVIPNTLYDVSIAAVNVEGFSTAYVSMGSTCTLANPPANLTVAYTNPSEVGLTWSANANPSSTTWQVLVSSDDFTTNFTTPIAFSANHTDTSARLTGLLTGTNYAIRVMARNQVGAETSFVSTHAFTDNGGGPAGSLVVSVPKGQMVVMEGNIGSSRRVSVRVPPNTFAGDTTLFISSADFRYCGNIRAELSVTPIPVQEIKGPFEISLSYVPGEANLGSLSTLGMVRYDAATRACVPLQSSVNPASEMVTAQINHLSVFQLAQLAPSGSIQTARIFPNPFYTRNQSYITFDHLPAGTRVRVFTLHGEELFNRTANASGILTWNATNKSGRAVASGVYIVALEAGGDRRILKLAVVR